jgi:hypothetical protein
MIGWSMNVKQLVEWELAGETEVLLENCPNATRNNVWPRLGSNSGRGGGKFRSAAAELRKSKKCISQKQKNDYLGTSQ